MLPLVCFFCIFIFFLHCFDLFFSKPVKVENTQIQLGKKSVQFRYQAEMFWFQLPDERDNYTKLGIFYVFFGILFFKGLIYNCIFLGGKENYVPELIERKECFGRFYDWSNCDLDVNTRAKKIPQLIIKNRGGILPTLLHSKPQPQSLLFHSIL